jgi:hypothetical protein
MVWTQRRLGGQQQVAAPAWLRGGVAAAAAARSWPAGSGSRSGYRGACCLAAGGSVHSLCSAWCQLLACDAATEAHSRDCSMHHVSPPVPGPTVPVTHIYVHPCRRCCSAAFALGLLLLLPTLPSPLLCVSRRHPALLQARRR